MKVAICIEIKNENRYIREWLDYHRELGFDNVILYDNNDSNGENVFDVIGEEMREGYVIYENIKDKTNYQLPCYNECLNKYGKKFDWMLFLDCDEFLELKSHSSIKDYLSESKFNGFEQILINLDNYGDSDLIYDDERGVLERFKTKRPRIFTDSCLSTKPCLNLNNYVVDKYVYKGFPNCISNLYNTTCDVSGNKIFPTRILLNKNDDCVIRHYKTKTIEEYLERHKSDCHYDMNIQLVAKKLKGFFEVNDSQKRIDEKVKIIQREFPWYNYYPDHCSPIDIVIINDDDNPLLSYTIKSIKKNLPWYNNIFVVTENTIDVNGVICVDFKDIVSPGFEEKRYAELLLHNITGLSERFVYVYSGTLFNYICFEEEFFRGNKVCMAPMSFNLIPKKSKKLCYNNNALYTDRKDITCKETFRVSKSNFGYMFSHVCCPMLKSDNKSCFEYLKKHLEDDKNNINHLIYPIWSRLMYHSIDVMHTNVTIEECKNMLLEIEDPIYKIINIPLNCVSDEMKFKLKEMYE